MRVHRLTAALIAIIALAIPSAAAPRTLPVVDFTAKAVVTTAQQQQLHRQARTIAKLESATWACQDLLTISRSKASLTPWQQPISIPYRAWVIQRWSSSRQRCNQETTRRTIPATGDWQTAVNLVQRIYPGTKEWLLFISHREGGYGSFVMNHQGSGAGGWMQFMAGTFYSHNDDAYSDARHRGFLIDPETNRWTHPLGQAVTAAYMRYTHQDACHWCP